MPILATDVPSSENTPAPSPAITILNNEVFPQNGSSNTFLTIPGWSAPVTFFVGRNGSGKSRTAHVVSKKVVDSRRLSTDRLVGLMSFINYGWGTVPSEFKGAPLGGSDRSNLEQQTKESGLATSDVYALKEQPEVALRVAAFLRKTLHREVEIRESAGYLDPYIRIGGTSYSLFRDEGHGLRELVVLLIAIYRADTRFLVVDEPELHLHASMARLWLSELRREYSAQGKHALIVTHDPGLIRPRTLEDLNNIYHFSSTRPPTRFSDAVMETQRKRIETSLTEYPALVSDLLFSPRPVLVEGPTDVAAISTALRRKHPPAVVEQTDLVPCSNSMGVMTWFEVTTKLDLDARAVVDLDALFTPAFKRVLDGNPEVIKEFEIGLKLAGQTTKDALAPFIKLADDAKVAKDEKSRANWLSRDENLKEEIFQERKRWLLELSRKQGIWLHPQGTLEDVLRLKVKSREAAATAAASPGPIDEVADWVAYQLDPAGEVLNLLSSAVVGVCQAIQQALLLDPAQSFSAPVGLGAEPASRLVEVRPADQAGFHRVTVKTPEPYSGWFVEFDINTPAPNLVPQDPDKPSSPAPVTG